MNKRFLVIILFVFIAGFSQSQDSLKVEQLDVIQINSIKSSISKTVSGQIEYSEKQIESTPLTLGEQDIYKLIQTTPGVQLGSEGQSGLLVRGGNGGMNLNYIDGVYLHNTSHVGGMFSLINADFIQHLTFNKAGFDASYGGRLSSVTSLKTKHHFKKFFVKGAVGLVTSKVTSGIPIKKLNTNLLVSGRRTYFDLIQPLFINQIGNKNTVFGAGKKYFFYDYLIKTYTKINNQHQVNFIHYNTKDQYENKSDIDNNQAAWQNSLYGLNWKSKLTKHLKNKLYVSQSTYKLNFKGQLYPIEFDLQSFYKTQTIKDILHFKTKKLTLETGVELERTKVLPKALEASIEDSTFDIPNQETYQFLNTSFFIDNKYKFSDRLKVKLGIRYTRFSIKASNVFNAYHKGVFEPRLSANYELKPEEYLKISYQNLYQFTHQSTISSYSTPIDFFIPSHQNLTPQHGQQFSLSYGKELDFGNVEIALYHKKVQNYTEFIQGSINTLFIENIYEDVVSGILKSSGIEFSTNLNISDRLNGNLSYTFSSTKAQFEDLNNGKPFSVIFDRPHNLNTSLHYNWNKKAKIGLNFVLASGQKFTPPEQITLNLTLYNLYNRKNPFFVNYDTGSLVNATQGVTTNIETLFPFLPTLSWIFSFK